MSDTFLHKLYAHDKLLAIKCNVDNFCEGVNFFTDKNMGLQVGVLKHQAGTVIQAHEHKKILRKVELTNEVLIILYGKIKANFYYKRELVESWVCGPGDILLLLEGGHGFEIVEEACIIEAKLGPYLEQDDKIRFDANET